MGQKGAPGEFGINGPEGAPGQPGLIFSGPKGYKGATGRPGLRGISGKRGPTGLPGIPGLKGLTGDIGEPGFAISPKGERGNPGISGFYGLKGIKGDAGDLGLAGFKGYQGPTGMKGERGDEGYEGLNGYSGAKGMKGDRGDEILPSDVKPGPMGEVGPPGFDGQPGRAGAPGNFGENGIPGFKGERGDIGDIGPEGLLGKQGEQGFMGIKGEIGFDGVRGLPGLPGLPAPPPPIPKSRGFYFTVHSQTHLIPECPSGTTPLWEGFSLLHIVANSKAHGQDLGAPGSCLRRFSTMPYMFCNINNVCDFAQREDYSFWLSTPEPMPSGMTPIPATDVGSYISRCQVCETSTRSIAIHSQSSSIPTCPDGWDELWIGYSFLMHTAGADAAGQSLISPGSCLREFRTRPFIECNGLGRCNFFATAVSYWLSTIDDNKMFETPIQETLKQNKVSRVSRCAVCMRRQPQRSYSAGTVEAVPNAVVRRPVNRPINRLRPRYPPRGTGEDAAIETIVP
ncbi:unnamed protein product [Danaus chrysippus]|uniref:(African queen) hypothetical protein n=1 Tax=Danaus chrysippus TaxID=151541 RepID=A0A8J2W253_9NEOP|nr:unnamed protein product [Danaus chrysippus]